MVIVYHTKGFTKFYIPWHLGGLNGDAHGKVDELRAKKYMSNIYVTKWVDV